MILFWYFFMIVGSFFIGFLYSSTNWAHMLKAVGLDPDKILDDFKNRNKTKDS